MGPSYNEIIKVQLGNDPSNYIEMPLSDLTKGVSWSGAETAACSARIDGADDWNISCDINSARIEVDDWNISCDIDSHVADEVKHIIEEKEKEKDMTVKYITLDRVIFNGTATIVFWSDGTKTVVKCMDGDSYAYDVGIAMATLKKMLGENYGGYKHDVRKAIDAELERQMRLEEKKTHVTKEDNFGLNKVVKDLMKLYNVAEDEVKAALKRVSEGSKND